jgi:hypothetical protein
MTSAVSAGNPTNHPRPANLTRRTPDFTRKFWRSGQWHLIPLYHFLRLSDLAREGIERSGSYRFADHLYLNRASGRGLPGRWLDRIVLNTRAARAMRQRYYHAVREIALALQRKPGTLRVLAIPCGIPRDVLEYARRNPDTARRIHYTGMDLDPEVLAAAQDALRGTTLHSQTFVQGSALSGNDFPEGPFDLILSTGLGEFLDTPSLQIFYQNVHAHLADGGVFYTSATARERSSDYLLRAFELNTHYRSKEEIAQILERIPWSNVELEQDATGLQTFVRAGR